MISRRFPVAKLLDEILASNAAFESPLEQERATRAPEEIAVSALRYLQ